MTNREKRNEIAKDLMSRSEVQVNVRLPVRLRARMEEFLQYLDQPLEQRVPESEYWPTSMQALVRAALEDYLAHRPLKQRTGKPIKQKPKPKRKQPEPTTKNIKPTKHSQEMRARRKDKEANNG